VSTPVTATSVSNPKALSDSLRSVVYSLWKDRLLIQVGNIVFIVLTVYNFLGTLIPIALELELHV
jgi:cytochrome c biogenesis factor